MPEWVGWVCLIYAIMFAWLWIRAVSARNDAVAELHKFANLNVEAKRRLNETIRLAVADETKLADALARLDKISELSTNGGNHANVPDPNRPGSAGRPGAS